MRSVEGGRRGGRWLIAHLVCLPESDESPFEPPHGAPSVDVRQPLPAIRLPRAAAAHLLLAVPPEASTPSIPLSPPVAASNALRSAVAVESFSSWVVKGDVAVQRERYDEALQCYRKALDMRPPDPNARRKIAVTLTLAGRPEAAWLR